jgi:hypothetical protein
MTKKKSVVRDLMKKATQATAIEAVDIETLEDIAAMQDAEDSGRVLDLGELAVLADRQLERVGFLVRLGELPAQSLDLAAEQLRQVREMARQGKKWL